MSVQQREALAARLLPLKLTGDAPPVAVLRGGFAAFMASLGSPVEVRREAVRLGGRPAVALRPVGEPSPGTILYFHGGSSVFGSPDTALALTAELVDRTGVRAVSLDYRLAPEHPFPAAQDDALAAYRELLDAGEDPARIALAGDSAGGGLAVTTALAARDAGLRVPAAIVAFSAGLDATRAGASMRTREAVDPFFTREALVRTGALVLDGADPRQPLLSPAVVGDLSGLPPLLLQVGTDEVLLDDSTRLAVRAREAGADVVLDVVAGVPHVFQAFVRDLDEAGEALERAALFLRQRLSRPTAA